MRKLAGGKGQSTGGSEPTKPTHINEKEFNKSQMGEEGQKGGNTKVRGLRENPVDY